MGTYPPTLLTLNHDVLASIISLLSPRDALSLSSVNTRARTIPVGAALRIITLSRAESVPSFRDYLRNLNARPSLLRSLKITTHLPEGSAGDGNDVAEAMADILEQAAALHILDVDLEDCYNGRILDAITQLQDLEELTLKGRSPQTLELITNMRSLTVRKLVVDLAGILWAPFDAVFRAFTRFSQLESLKLKGSRASRESFLLPRPLISDITMPSIHTFVILHATMPLSLVASIFPNLRFLKYRSYPWHVRPRTAPNSDSPSASPPLWQHTLSEIDIDPLDLNRWTLSCTTDLLSMDFIHPWYSPDAVVHMITQTKPRIWVCGCRMDYEMTWNDLPESATSLRFLDLRICETSKYPKNRVLKLFVGFPALTTIFLCIRAYYDDKGNDKLSRLAQKLAVGNPQLRFIGISFRMRSSRSRTPYFAEESPVQEEELSGSRWWAVKCNESPGSNSAGNTAGDGSQDKRLIRISTAVGLKVREHMFKAGSDWDAELNRMYAECLRGDSEGTNDDGDDVGDLTMS